MKAILYLVNGPLGGQEFDAEISGEFAPVKLSGQDIHRALVGVYELVKRKTPEPKLSIPVFRYRLRVDEDYQRVYQNWSGYKRNNQVEGL